MIAVTVAYRLPGVAVHIFQTAAACIQANMCWGCAALNAGVLIFENCPVTAIGEQMPARIETQQGSVLADAVIIVSSAFTPATLKRFDHLMGVFRIGAFETSPLSEAQLESIAGPGRAGEYAQCN